jgi:GTPase SAR1 family protein
MGICGSSTGGAAVYTEDDKEKRTMVSADLDKQLLHQSKVEEEKIKLLLLGAGESGKSTIFKQMKVIYGTQFTDAERRAHTPTIFSNIISSMKILVDQAAKMNLLEKVVAKDDIECMRNASEHEVIKGKLGEAIKNLWQDPGIQLVWSRRNEFQIVDSVQYYFNKIDVIRSPDFLPDKDDIIHARVRTSGIVTEKYNIDGTLFEMYDVGGQRNERRKWIHCFEGVTAVIFVAALSEYDQRLFEDGSVNRMEEALKLFDEICNNPVFTDSSMLLFLNKKDLFMEKIKDKRISDTPAFKGYSGRDGDYEAGVQYFVDQFLAKNTNRNRHIYHHVTCATDTKNVQVVFDACKDIILRQSIKQSPFGME